MFFLFIFTDEMTDKRAISMFELNEEGKKIMCNTQVSIRKKMEAKTERKICNMKLNSIIKLPDELSYVLHTHIVENRCNWIYVENKADTTYYIRLVDDG